jgi:hypothetical protein
MEQRQRRKKEDVKQRVWKGLLRVKGGAGRGNLNRTEGRREEEERQMKNRERWGNDSAWFTQSAHTPPCLTHKLALMVRSIQGFL